MNGNYRPEESSSSDSEYDGFYGDFVEARNSYFPARASQEALMAEAVVEGDLETLRRLIRETTWQVDELMDNDLTLLQLAAIWGQAHIVRYLVHDRNAHLNFTRTNLPPLLLACQSTHKRQEILLLIVKCLIENGASKRVTDQYQTTGLMFAAAKGYTQIIQYWIESGGDVDARDNNGDTALFHAIEQNQLAAVRLLLQLEADAFTANYKGYTPMQVAQFYGFSDIIDILPRKAETYLVPYQFTSYNTLRDYIPQIFLKSDCPEYFQEVAEILRANKRLSYLPKLAVARVSLEKFLNLDEQQLVDLGFNLRVHRMCIKRMILKFFLSHWETERKKTEQFSSALRDNNFHNVLLMTASHLKQLVVLCCAMRYIRSNMQEGLFGSISLEDVQRFQEQLVHYKNSIKDAQTDAAYLASFSPAKNPLYINYDEFLIEQKREKMRATFKRTLLIMGISAILFVRLRKLFN